MHGVLFANGTVFLQLQTVGIVAFIFKAVVISVLAFGTFKRDFHSRGLGCHLVNSITKKLHPAMGVYLKFNIKDGLCQSIL